MHNTMLNTERRIRVPETETEGQEGLVQEKCWSGTESKGTEKLLWLPNPHPKLPDEHVLVCSPSAPQ